MIYLKQHHTCTAFEQFRELFVVLLIHHQFNHYTHCLFGALLHNYPQTFGRLVQIALGL